MTDNILFVKEAKLCSYVLVIHTPRLCGQPGFRSRGVDASDVALIKCREIVDSPPDPSALSPSNVSPLREADAPLKSAHRKPTSSPDSDSPPAAAAAPPNEESKMSEDASSGEQPTDRYNDLIRTLSLLMSGKVDGQVIQVGDNGEFVIEIVDDRSVNTPNADHDGAAAASVQEGQPLDGARAEAENVIVEVLRAAGLDFQVTRQPEETSAASEKESKSHPNKGTDEAVVEKRRDEL
jgi:hypothetical protein